MVPVLISGLSADTGLCMKVCETLLMQASFIPSLVPQLRTGPTPLRLDSQDNYLHSLVTTCPKSCLTTSAHFQLGIFSDAAGLEPAVTIRAIPTASPRAA